MTDQAVSLIECARAIGALNLALKNLDGGRQQAPPEEVTGGTLPYRRGVFFRYC